MPFCVSLVAAIAEISILDFLGRRIKLNGIEISGISIREKRIYFTRSFGNEETGFGRQT